MPSSLGGGVATGHPRAPAARVRFFSLAALALALALVLGIVEGVITAAGCGFRDLDFLWSVPVFDVVVAAALFLPWMALAPLAGRRPALLGWWFSFCSLKAFDWGKVHLSSRAGPFTILALAAVFAALLTYALHRWQQPLLLRAWWSALGPLGLTAVLAIGVGGGKYLQERKAFAQLPPAAPDGPNVLLIIVDTLQADHLTPYGYQRNTSPNLERLAEQGLLFENAIAPSSWTLPSHASMMTGHYPRDHHAETPADVLDEGYPRIAEAFRARGYRTAAFSGNFSFFSVRAGMGRGFLHFEDSGHGIAPLFSQLSLGGRLQGWMHRLGYRGDLLGREHAHEVNQDALSWLGATERRPFFLVLNYFDVHDPYVPPEPYLHLFTKEEKPGGRISVQLNIYPEMGRREAEGEAAAYDGAIRLVDDSLQELLAALQDKGLLKNTIVVVTSDHGEAFGEHGLFGHGNDLSFEEIHVPLILWAPGRLPANVRIAHPVSLVDLPATLLRFADPRQAFAGDPLQLLWTGNVPAEQWSDPVSELAEMHFYPGSPNSRGPIRSLVTPDWHYIKGPREQEQLYDRRHDPAEQHDASASQPAVTAALGAALSASVHQAPRTHATRSQETKGDPSR